MSETISPNTTLAHYLILSKIGAGGMGEVYLAQDTKLDRKVALKILPADVASNRDRMERFVREAKAAAALSHPNIAQIFEIGEHNDTHYITMELVEGVTLREKIHREHTDLSRLLRYLQHVAEGLAKAHAAGIVHRDLKPDNIMITRDGHAKILDFGLAKLVELPQTSSANSEGVNEQATAILQQHSTPGMILGTAGYMSPEQAQGKIAQIDHRSDIFSFGCILYEAATGRKAFAGQDTLDSLHKVVHAPTPLIKDFRADAPDELQRVVRRCLAKDPEERYQSIKDVAIELKEVRRELEGTGIDITVSPSAPGEVTSLSGAEATASKTQSATISTQSNSLTTRASSVEYIATGIKQHKLVAVITAIVIAALGFGIYKFAGRSSSESKGPVPFQAMNMIKLTTTGKATEAAISPDGRYVVHVIDEGGKQSLWVKQVKIASASQRIVEPADAFYRGLTFSPDGNYVYYLRVAKGNQVFGTLYRIPVLGGTSNKLADNVSGRITFSPDGNRFAFVRRSLTAEDTALIIANADGSGEQRIAARKFPDDFGGDDSGPAWSADGKTLVCGVGNSVRNEMTVVEVQVEGGAERTISSQTWFRVGQIAWLPDASGLIMLATPQQAFSYQIWHLSYPSGKAERISKDLNNYLSISLTLDASSLVTVQNAAPSNIWVVPDADNSRAKQITFGAGTSDGSAGVSWTPDGRIVYETNASGNEDIWIMNADGSSQKQLTANVRVSEYPIVSPDGRHILSLNDRTGVPHVWRMDLDGGNSEQLTNGRGETPQSCSPDSQWLIYTSIPAIGLGKRSLWRMPIAGGESVLITDKDVSTAQVSPDGKLIAILYRDEAAGAIRKLAIVPFAGGEVVKTFDLPSDTSGVRWKPDGRALTYATSGSGIWNIWSQPLDGTTPKQITNWQSELILDFDWSHDGKRLAVARGQHTNDVILISNSK